jgi:NAD(P)-dependent dehydrogenase (short-subunit alcohol dehydrogenase family)
VAATGDDVFDLSGDVAVVIGGTGVLGGALAEGLGRAGAAVAVLGRNRERGEARIRQLADAGIRCSFQGCDAADRGSLERAHAAVTATLGAPTILVNAAGGNDPLVTVAGERRFEDLTLSDWEANQRLNLGAGVLLPCQVFGPGMVARRMGSIINIASVSAHVPLSRVASYACAKAAVLNLTQFLAREWARHGVRVNSITPGFFPAEQNRRLLFQEDGTPTERGRQILSHTPMARFGEAHELVGAAVFLACRAAAGFVTGADLRVDGGFLAQTI